MVSRRLLMLSLLACITVSLTVFAYQKSWELLSNETKHEHKPKISRKKKTHDRPISIPSSIKLAQNGRYESAEIWRTQNWFASDFSSSTLQQDNRPKLHDELLETPIIADYAPGSEKLFLMVKTGANVLWQRLPIHLSTILTRVPNFALYSDAPGSIAGYEVIDILTNLTDESKNTPEFTQYRKQKWLHDNVRVLEYTSLELNDGWQLDKFKNIPMITHAYNTSPNCDWFLFIDADTYLNLDNLMDLVKDLNPNQVHYRGLRTGSGHYAFCHGGSGVLLSRAALEQTVAVKDWAHIMETRTFKECCGDLMVGYLMIDTLQTVANDTKGFNSCPYWDLELTAESWCDPIITFHHVAPRDIELMWEYEKTMRASGKKVTRSSLYQDFFLPFMIDKRDNWDNRAHSDIFSSYKYDKENGLIPKTVDGKKTEQAYESFEACKTFCEKHETCLSFRLDYENQRCDISDSFRYGRPVEEGLKTSNDYMSKNVTSGWILERIQNFRKKSRCDDLEINKLDPWLMEGWFTTNVD